MKVLITGADGQLGKDLIQVLTGDHLVIGLNKTVLDITKEKQIASALQTHHPDVVINCAAFTKVDTAETERTKAWQVNVEGPKLLAGYCHSLNIILLHFSTDYVFDGERLTPQSYEEGDPTAPISYYGLSKLAGEQAIASCTDRFAIIRTAWLYGIGGPNFLKTMLRLALQGKKLKVVNDQFGALTWSYRLAQQVKLLMEREVRGVYHATAEGFGTWYQGAKLFLEEMGIDYLIEPCQTSEYPTPARRPQNSILENRRLKDEGVNLMVDWKQDIARFAALNREALLNEAKGQTS